MICFLSWWASLYADVWYPRHSHRLYGAIRILRRRSHVAAIPYWVKYIYLIALNVFEGVSKPACMIWISCEAQSGYLLAIIPETQHCAGQALSSVMGRQEHVRCTIYNLENKVKQHTGWWSLVLKVDAHGAHVLRTKESWEDQKAGWLNLVA